MNKFWQKDQEKKQELTLEDKEKVSFQEFVKEQLTILRKRGLSLPVATL